MTRLVLRVPSLDNQAAEEDVASFLSLSPGIGRVEADWRTGTVIVETANSDGGVDVLRKLRNAGYPAEEGVAGAQEGERG